MDSGRGRLWTAAAGAAAGAGLMALVGPRPAGRGGAAAMVRQFHTAFGLPAAAAPLPSLPSDLAGQRLALLEEEFRECVAATAAGDPVAVADALADIVYVCYGTALAFGVNLDAVLTAVHRSNMAKAGGAGPVVDRSGKVVKPAGWRPPDVAGAAGLPAPAAPTGR